MYKKTFVIITVLFILFSVNTALANNADIGIVAKLTNEFKVQSDKWYSTVLQYSLNLFYLFAVLEIGYFGIRMVLGSTDLKDVIKEFCMLLLAIGFFFVVINNYEEWTAWVVSDLEGIVSSTGTSSSDNPLKIGMAMIDEILRAVEELSWTEMGLAIAFYLCIFIIFICFCIISANVIVIKCESVIAILASLVLVAFGASNFLREYATNALRYVVSVGFKLFVLQLILEIGIGFVNNLHGFTATFDNCLVIIGFSLVLLVVSQKVPEIVAGIVTGSHTGNGGGLGFASGLVAGTASGITNTAVGAGSAVAGMKRAASIAKSEGATGFGVVTGGFKAIRQASLQGKINKTSMGLELKDRIQKIKELNK